MARQVVPLSDTEIKKAKPKEKDYKLFDGNGLFLLIKPNGGKWWRLKYFIDGKEKSLSLGTYPEVSLLKAREKRDQHKISIADGINPSTERKEAKASIKAQEDESLNTFKNCSKDYFELIRTKISEGHFAKQWQRLVSNNCSVHS